ncbi:collagen, type I, alpha 1a [Gorilla gorilla gorilla]|uniref:collagen, type I, alpha 1a n=1 Tax=Gorilla gorilla gorilla TaxID=9595 RepID=UPI00300B6E81
MNKRFTVQERKTERSRIFGRERKAGRVWRGRGTPGVGGNRGASGSREAESRAGRGLRREHGALAAPRPRSLAFPAARAQRGRRSPDAVAGRGVQGALWPSGAGGRSGHPTLEASLRIPACRTSVVPPQPCAPGPAWRRSSGIRVAAAARAPMRLGGCRALAAVAAAAAATAAPTGVGGFAAAPGAAPVPSGGGFRLRDDPPGHAEAEAGAAREIHELHT